MAYGCPDTGDLVGCNAGSYAASADDNAANRLLSDDLLRNRQGKIRIIRGLVIPGADINDRMAIIPEKGNYLLLQMKPAVVCADCNFHALIS
jgi:hypothetical protein